MSVREGSTLRGVVIEDLAAHPAPFVTVRAVARYWGVDVTTVYRDIRKGALTVYRLPSGQVRVKTSDALAYGAPLG